MENSVKISVSNGKEAILKIINVSFIGKYSLNLDSFLTHLECSIPDTEQAFNINYDF